MLHTQVLALTLIPLLSGAFLTDKGEILSPLVVVGIEETVSAEYLAGTWRCTDDYHQWGVTDRGEAHTGRFSGNSLMVLNSDGTAEMIDFFVPDKGRWRLADNKLILEDPAVSRRGTQVIPIRKRGQDSIWLMLPFAGGAVGVGMSRVQETQAAETKSRAARKDVSPAETRSDRSGSRVRDIRITDVDDVKKSPGDTPESSTDPSNPAENN